MRRKKRVATFRVALAVGLVAVVAPAAAQGKPLPSGPSNDQGMPVYVISGPDDRSHQRSEVASPAPEIPYLSHGVGVSEAELGIATSNSPDDRGFARTTGEQPVLVSDGSSFDVNPYAVTGFGLMLVLMAGGMGLAIRHSRKTRLSPA